MKTTISILASLGMLGVTSSSHAAITLIGHYGLGEAGTTNGGGAQASPYTQLVDDAGTAQNIQSSNGITSTAIVTTGVAAPGSSAYLTKTQAGGWYHNDADNIFGLANTAANWATQIWIRPGTDAGTLGFQTDSQGGTATGESIWFQFGGTGVVAFGNGTQGTDNPVSSGLDYTLETWYRIGIVNYNGTMHYYIDGTEVGGTGTARAGTLSSIQIGWAGGSFPTSGAFDELNVWSFDNTTDSLASVTATMNAVPEPSAALLGGLGVLALLRRRRA